MEGMNITIKKNDIITLEITDITAEGSGVGHENGMAVFVPSAAKGDIISCRIVKVLKNLCYGIVEEIITPSPDRQDRGCDVKKACGGCVFRHISYESELDIKNNIVKFPPVLKYFMEKCGLIQGEQYEFRDFSSNQYFGIK